MRRPSLRARGPLPRKALGVASLRDAYPGEGECRQARSLQPGAWAPRPVAGGSPARPSAQRCSRVFPSTSMSVASSAPSSAPPSARASLAACLPFCLAQRPRWAIAFLPAAWLPAFRRLRSGLAQSERPCWQAGRLAGWLRNLGPSLHCRSPVAMVDRRKECLRDADVLRDVLPGGGLRATRIPLPVESASPRACARYPQSLPVASAGATSVASATEMTSGSSSSSMADACLAKGRPAASRLATPWLPLPGATLAAER